MGGGWRVEGGIGDHGSSTFAQTSFMNTREAAGFGGQAVHGSRLTNHVLPSAHWTLHCAPRAKKVGPEPANRPRTGGWGGGKTPFTKRSAFAGPHFSRSTKPGRRRQATKISPAPSSHESEIVERSSLLMAMALVFMSKSLPRTRQIPGNLTVFNYIIVPAMAVPNKLASHSARKYLFLNCLLKLCFQVTRAGRPRQEKNSDKF